MVLAQLAHVHAGHRGVGVALVVEVHAGVEEHELEELEAVDRRADELPEPVAAVETVGSRSRRLMTIGMSGTKISSSSPHAAAGGDVGVRVLQPAHRDVVDGLLVHRPSRHPRPTSQNTNPSRSTTSPTSMSIGAREARRVPHERVELAALTARVDTRRQLGEQGVVEGAAGELGPSTVGSTQVSTARTPAPSMSRARRSVGRPHKREHRGDPGAGERASRGSARTSSRKRSPNTIRSTPSLAGDGEGAGHRGLVHVVRARRRDVDDVDGQRRGARLGRRASSRRTACMATRSAAAFMVTSSATTSSSSSVRATCERHRAVLAAAPAHPRPVPHRPGCQTGGR